MSENINIVARRIFNLINEDVGNRYGVRVEWAGMSPNARQDIRGTWEQIFTEEIEKHTAELQARVNRLEEALVAELKNAELRYEQEQRDGDGISIASTRARFIALRDACGILQAKESNP